MRHFSFKHILLCICLSASINGYAYDFVRDGIYYTILSEEDATCEVASEYDDDYVTSSYSGYVNIPEIVVSSYYPRKEYTVVGIGDWAFYGSQLESVSLPSTIVRIEDYAFYCCEGISSLSITEQIEYIGDNAFSNSDFGGSLTIPISCKYVGSSAFFDTDITDLTFERIFAVYLNNLCTIGDIAFGNCDNLVSANLNGLFYHIGINPFMRCDNLTAIDGWGGYTNQEGTQGYLLIDGCIYSFTEEEDVRSLELLCCPAGKSSYTSPNSYTGIEQKTHILTTIGNDAFVGCTKITYLDFPNTVTKIRDNAFFMRADSGPDHTNADYTYRRVNIPESVEEMGYCPFGWFGYNWDIYLYSTKVKDISLVALPRLNGGDGFGTIHIPYGTKASFNTANVEQAFYVVDDIGDRQFVIEDGTVFNNDVMRENADISYNRTFNNTNWQALYVPFSMSYDDWKEDFDVAEINNFHEYDDDEDGTTDRTTLEVVYKKSGSSQPNTPYMIRAKQTGTKTLSLENTTLYPAEENSIDCSSVKTNYTFTGTYTGVSGEEMYSNGFYALASGVLNQAASSNVSLGSFRWYLKPEIRRSDYTTTAPLRQISVRVIGENDDETTGLSNTNENEIPVEYYNLRGERIVPSNTMDIYIVKHSNGRIKKVIK